MKILHVTAIGFFVKKSGVPAVLKNLVSEQNKISGVEARVLYLRSKVDENDSSIFDELGDMSISEYLKSYSPDFVIFHTIFYVKYVEFVWYVKKHHILFAIEPHGSFGKQAMKKSWLKKKIACNTLFRPLINDSIAYIYTNEAEKRDSVYIKALDAIIPNGINEEDVLTAPEKNRENFHKPIFYYLGRYSIHHKGLDYLMDALQILDNLKIDITVYFYGVGDKNEIDYIQKRIAHFQSISAYDKGTIYGKDKIKALGDANILLLTSRYEGSPITILDSLSFGNPCVVTPGTNVADELEDNHIGWKTPLDAQSIADIIIRAKDEYSKNAELYVNRCKSYVLSKYRWQSLAEFSIIEYKRIINSYTGV